MGRRGFNPRWQAALLIPWLAVATPAHAGGVVVCDNCANPKQAAVGSGAGTTLVVDFLQVKINGDEVEYDRELKRYRALPTQIPAPVNEAFLRVMALAQTHGPAGTAFTPQAGGNGAVIPVIPSIPSIPVHPDDPDDPGGAHGIAFPEALKGLTAYDVVQSATTRSPLETGIGSAFSGAKTGSTVWNLLSTTPSSVRVSFVSRLFGVSSVTYAVTWRDGSQTLLELEPDSVHQAHHVKGKSRDAQGNPIPDAAATGPEAPGIFGGDHHFQDRHAIENRLHAAKLHGVHVDNVGIDSLQLRCTWNGETLACGGR